MPRKEKVMDKNDSFDDTHDYRCLRCGMSWKNPVGHFYKSQWSKSFEKNDKYVHLCTNCVKELFEYYEKKYNTNIACILLCYKLDISNTDLCD